MARKYLIFIALLVLISTLTSSINGRKLMVAERRRGELPAVDGSLYLQAALPKGTVPNSAPSKKGHADIVDEKLIARHLGAVDRILRSVPSPGMGH